MKMKNNLARLRWVSGWLVMFFFILLGNILTPYLVDDYCWTKVQNVGIKQAIESSIKQTLWCWYNFSGSLSECFSAKFFMSYNKTLFNFVNSLMLVLLCYLIYRLMNLHKNIRSMIFWPLILLFFSFLPVPTQTVFWLVGSTAYLWPLVFVLLFITPYSLYDTNGRNTFLFRISWVLCPIMGLLAGNAKGTVGGMSVILSVAFIIRWFVRRMPIPIWSILGLLSVAAGVAITIMTPGYLVRSQTFGIAPGLSQVLRQGFTVVRSQGVLIVILVTAFCFYIKRFEDKKRMLDNALIYSVAIAIGLLVCLFVPASERTYLFFPCFAVIALGNMSSDVHAIKSALKIRGLIYVILLAHVLISCGTIFYDAYRCKRIIDYRAEYIRRKVVEKSTVIVVPNLTDHIVYRRYTGNLTDLQESSESWENQAMAQFFGAEKIVGQRFCNGFVNSLRLF